MESAPSPLTDVNLVSSTSDLLPGELPQPLGPPPSVPSSSSPSSVVVECGEPEPGELAALAALRRASDCPSGTSSFSVCTMKTVSLSSLLMPSPCFTVLLLLCPPVLGFVIFLFVQYFVPVLVDILMAM